MTDDVALIEMAAGAVESLAGLPAGAISRNVEAARAKGFDSPAAEMAAALGMTPQQMVAAFKAELARRECARGGGG